MVLQKAFDAPCAMQNAFNDNAVRIAREQYQVAAVNRLPKSLREVVPFLIGLRSLGDVGTDAKEVVDEGGGARGVLSRNEIADGFEVLK